MISDAGSARGPRSLESRHDPRHRKSATRQNAADRAGGSLIHAALGLGGDGFILTVEAKFAPPP
jgi:hypothetical protein